MDRAELLDEVAEDLFAYVMAGSVSERRIASKLGYDELDDRFADFDSLVDLHFLLRPAVVDFVERLPRRLRSIKTQTKNVRSVTRGEISGRIDWHGTVTTRHSKAPGDRSLFVCTDRQESYDVDENVVLKRLLSIIYTTLDDCEEYLRREYDWVTDRWRENLELVDRLRETFERNVHVVRIRDPESYEPTERMLSRAERARNEIYREAAGLLREHRRSRRGDEAALRELLAETTIAPDDEETLFELYVLFRYLRAIEARHDGSTTVATIESGSQEVARVEREDGADVVLYHDASARDRGLSFVPEAYEKPEAELGRSELVRRESRRVLEQYFADARAELHTNRPDVIVLEVRRDDRFEYLVTEVKYSRNPETIRQGVEETLEYLAFLRREEAFVFDDDRPFGSGWNGVLVVQDLEDRSTAPIEEQRTIRILQASELSERVHEVLDRVM